MFELHFMSNNIPNISIILSFIKQTYLAKKERREKKVIWLKPLGSREKAPSGGRQINTLQKTVISFFFLQFLFT